MDVLFGQMPAQVLLVGIGIGRMIFIDKQIVALQLCLMMLFIS